jgi:hypothetical protein
VEQHDATRERNGLQFLREKKTSVSLLLFSFSMIHSFISFGLKVCLLANHSVCDFFSSFQVLVRNSFFSYSLFVNRFKKNASFLSFSHFFSFEN